MCEALQVNATSLGHSLLLACDTCISDNISLHRHTRLTEKPGHIAQSKVTSLAKKEFRIDFSRPDKGLQNGTQIGVSTLASITQTKATEMGLDEEL